MKNKITGLILFVVGLTASAYAANRVQLKPDSASAAPCSVWTAGMSCGRGDVAGANGKIIDVVGSVAVSTSASSSLPLCFAGAFQTLPTSGYAEGCVAYQLSDHKAYVSTGTVVGTGSWVALF